MFHSEEACCVREEPWHSRNKRYRPVPLQPHAVDQHVHAPRLSMVATHFAEQYLQSSLQRVLTHDRHEIANALLLYILASHTYRLFQVRHPSTLQPTLLNDVAIAFLDAMESE